MSREEFFEKIQYYFNDLSLFDEAMTHKSYIQESGDSKVPFNERMEFLGDAILEVVISQLLYQRLSDANEGKLTSFRINIVRGKTLAKVAKKISLGEMLIMGKGEEAQGGRDKESILADGMEALIAAVFLDSNYERVREFIRSIFDEVIDQVIKSHDNDNYKSEFQEMVQVNGSVDIKYVLTGTEGPGHARRFFVDLFLNGKLMGSGSGTSKKEAEQAAAKAAIYKV